jgi:hypothetical protein
MDLTVFGNIVNILAGLVTIGAPIFSVFRVVMRNNKQSNIVSPQTISSRPQGRVPLNRSSQMKTNVIPWYLWVKAILHAFMQMIEQPMIIMVYLMGGVLLVGVVFVFCILVGIPTGWLNETSLGTRMLLLCTLLIASLHFSIEFAEHTDEFLQKELEEKRARRKGA